jgi:hypothetical protein
VTRLTIIFALALAGAVTVLVLFANLLLVATNAPAQTTTFRDRGSTPASSCPRSEMPIFIAIIGSKRGYSSFARRGRCPRCSLIRP